LLSIESIKFKYSFQDIGKLPHPLFTNFLENFVNQQFRFSSCNHRTLLCRIPYFFGLSISKAWLIQGTWKSVLSNKRSLL